MQIRRKNQIKNLKCSRFIGAFEIFIFVFFLCSLAFCIYSLDLGILVLGSFFTASWFLVL